MADLSVGAVRNALSSDPVGVCRSPEPIVFGLGISGYDGG